MNNVPYSREPISKKHILDKQICEFNLGTDNIDQETVASFGDEWTKFDQFTDQDIDGVASMHYFDIVPKEIYENKAVMDMGCGTGRWSKYIAQTVSSLDAVDPSDAIYVAAKNLSQFDTVRLTKASVNQLPFFDESFDFVFSLGVLHHIPNTQQAMIDTVSKLKRGGYFLVYLYYALENRSFLFRLLFKLSNIIRLIVSNCPHTLKNFFSDVLAILLYLPFVYFNKSLVIIGAKNIAKKMPLYFYHDKSYQIIRNDSRDRFGTPLEQRFTKEQIKEMMEKSGLTNIVFSDNEPYWHAIGQKK